MIKKAVIPVAGYGTRFLPFTKSVPKEMLPIIDRPVIQYIVEEAVAAGIKEIILITGYSKRAIEDYFDYNIELETLLERSGKLEQKKLIRDISDIASFIYVRQKEQLGIGHAILQAKDIIGDEPFVVMWGDEVYRGKPSKLDQLVKVYDEHKKPVIFVMDKDNPDDFNRYGYIKTKNDLGNGVFGVEDLIEKPGQASSPSSLASLGCFILPPEIFSILENQQPGKSGEIWLADAINTLAHQTSVLAKVGEGLTYYDCGNKLEYIKAVVDFALEREDISGGLKEYLKSKI